MTSTAEKLLVYIDIWKILKVKLLSRKVWALFFGQCSHISLQRGFSVFFIIVAFSLSSAWKAGSSRMLLVVLTLRLTWPLSALQIYGMQDWWPPEINIWWGRLHLPPTATETHRAASLFQYGHVMERWSSKFTGSEINQVIAMEAPPHFSNHTFSGEFSCSDFLLSIFLKYSTCFFSIFNY